MADPYHWIAGALETLHRAQWYRSPRPLGGLPGPVMLLEGRPVVNFGSNDYLGLAGEARLQQAAMEAIAQAGTGSTGSRLLTGQRGLHEDLERAIARFKQTEAALVFSAGYLANLGTIAALVGPRDLVLQDQYNHSSLKNGAKLSGARRLDYGHGDMAQLRSLLTKERPRHRRCLITTDSVFSMDGDLAPLPALVALAAEFEAMLLVDEAHGTGVLGATGAGAVEHFGLAGAPMVQIGTLSKALGSLGGYVAGSAILIDYLRNRAATWIYTTALSPADTAAAIAAIALVQGEPDRRRLLWERVEQLKIGLGETSGLKLLPSDSAILCTTVRDPETALRWSRQLQEAGFYVPAIRPPTVPTSRLRFSLMATHSPDQIAALLDTLRVLINVSSG